MRHKKRWLILALALLALLTVCLLAFDARLKVQRYTLTCDELTASIRIVLLTDLHSCKYGNDQSELLAAIDAQQPDLILLGGDIFDDVLPPEPAEALIQAVAGRYPCYYVTGNHEYWSENTDAFLAFLTDCGVQILDGSYETLQINGQYLNLCGITDPDAAAYSPVVRSTEAQLASLRDVSSNGYYTILLAHRPELIGTYAEYGFDLVLSGHAHGGQWRLPGLINGLYAPNQGLFPKYAGGAYTVGETKLIVSRGLARESTGIPRVFNRPELVVVELTPSGSTNQA